MTLLRHRLHSRRVDSTMSGLRDGKTSTTEKTRSSFCTWRVLFGMVLCCGVSLRWVFNSRGMSQYSSSSWLVNFGTSLGALPLFTTLARRRIEIKRPACRRPRTHQQIQECFPFLRQANLPVDNMGGRRPSCSNITTWDQVQHCFHHASTSAIQQNQLQEVHIIGERHSGTKFITSALQHCFPRTQGVRVHRDLLRSKHFFQPLDDIDSATPLQLYPREHHHVIVVVVREVVSWMAAMVEKPYHAPHHLHHLNDTHVHPLPWRDFVTRPWAPGVPEDNNTGASSCQHGFAPGQVVPCQQLDNETAPFPPWNIPLSRFRGFAPVYEMNAVLGRPYDNLLQLRADKIANFVLHVPLAAAAASASILVVRYEDVLRQGAAGPLIKPLGELLGRQATCRRPPPPQPERLQVRRRNVETEFLQWIADHVDVETENLLGYDMEWRQ